MNHPPHLPPPACNVPTHYKLRSLTQMIFLVCMACLAGVTATLVTVAWIIPTVSSVDSYARVQNLGRRQTQDTVDPLLVQQTKQRQIQIFDLRKKVRGAYYTEDAMLAEGIFLSSDGWAVVYQNGTPLPDVSQWEGVDVQGLTHRVEKSIKTAKAIYVRFDGEGFRIMPFASWEKIDVGTTVWSLTENRWDAVTIDHEEDNSAVGSFWPSDITAEYVFLPSGSKKSILLNDDGEFVGFADNSVIRVPGWKVEAELRSILSAGNIQHESFPWKGFFISRADDGHGLRESGGFYVESVLGKTSTSTVQAGDLVVAVEDMPVLPVNLPRVTQMSPNNATVRISRDGQEILVTAGKIELPQSADKK